MKELRGKLRQPIPPTGLKKHPSKSYLTVIDPYHVIERLNDVFGLGSWRMKVIWHDQIHEERKKRDGGTYFVYVATVHISFEIPDHNIYLEQFGGSDNDDQGDALKGAMTDALTKCCSYLEIGIDIYKGLANHNTQAPKKPQAQAKPEKQPFSQAVKGKMIEAIRSGKGEAVKKKMQGYVIPPKDLEDLENEIELIKAQS